MPVTYWKLMRAIPPSDLIFEWDRIRAGLLEVQKNSREDWIPEDVYMTIKQGGASLFVAEDEGGDYLGFLVLQVLPTFHGKRLHVWAAHSVHKQPLLLRFKNEVIEIAKQAGTNRITFSSPRDEWLKVGERAGFSPTQTTFALEI